MHSVLQYYLVWFTHSCVSFIVEHFVILTSRCKIKKGHCTSINTLVLAVNSVCKKLWKYEHLLCRCWNAFLSQCGLRGHLIAQPISYLFHNICPTVVLLRCFMLFICIHQTSLFQCNIINNTVCFHREYCFDN